jgi:hypothetical protein
MTLCIIVRTIEGIAIVTDTTTTTPSKRKVDGVDTVFSYHTYYRKKLVQIGNWAVVQTGTAFIGGKTVTQVIGEAKIEVDSYDELKESLSGALVQAFNQDPNVPNLPPNSNLLTLGLAGYDKDRLVTIALTYRKGDKEQIEVVEDDNTRQKPYGISYFGDHEFISMIIEAAGKRKLLKGTAILTIREALDLARTLLTFLIDFQKFMVISTVDYPIESAVITHDDGFTWVDEMEIEPLR